MRYLSVLLVALCLTAASGVEAYAQSAMPRVPSPRELSTGSVERSALVVDAKGRKVPSAQRESSVLKYWTKQRIRNARPLIIRAPSSWNLRSATKLTSRKLEDVRPNTRVSRNVTVQHSSEVTVGKLLFTDPEGDSYCSATTLLTNSMRLILTAAHCLYLADTWSTDVMFLASYNNGTDNGKYPAATFRVPHAWFDEGGPIEYDANTISAFSHDVGFVMTYDDSDGYAPAFYVGGMYTKSGDSLSYSFAADVFGYPSNFNNGEPQEHCSGTTSQAPGGDPMYTIGCNFDEGASGGPWIDSYNASQHYGLVRSVTSMIGEDGTNWGPHLGNWFTAEMQQAENDWKLTWVSNVNSALCLRPAHQGTAGDDVVQVVCTKSDELDEWNFVINQGVAPGYLEIENAVSGYCLQTPGGSAASGVQMVQDNCSLARDKWKLINVATQYTEGAATQWIVKNKASGLCLNIKQSSTTSGAPVIQYACNSNANNEIFNTFPAQGGIFNPQ